jgi:hypothetical protein
LQERVEDFISVSSRHARRSAGSRRNNPERREKIAREMLDIRSASRKSLTGLRRDSIKSKFLAALNARMCLETDFPND